MVTEGLINTNISRFTDFQGELESLITEYKQLRDGLNREDNDLLWRWYGHCNESYALHRRAVSDYLEGSSISEKSLTASQYKRQIGERIFPLLLGLIFSAEQIFNNLRKEQADVKALIGMELEPLIESLEEKWTESDEEIRKNVITSVRQGSSSFAKLRCALIQADYISEDDGTLLQKIWTMRNASHQNFIATSKIDFSFKNKAGTTFNYMVEKGDPLITPNWLITELTEALSMIVIKAVTKTNP